MREDWVECKFEDIATNLKRGPFGGDLKKEIFVDSGYKIYEQQHAIKNDFSLGKYYINEDNYNKLRACEALPGDYIVSCSGTMGKIARIPNNSEKGIINQALLRIRIEDRLIIHRYFIVFFRSNLFQEKILRDTRGSGMQNMASIKEIKPINIILPPLPEQRAIVKKIEELFSSLDAGIADLKKAQEQLKIYRQAVLKKAFEGELTKEWREMQNDLPSVDEILDEIKIEREKYYQAQLEEWKKDVEEWEKNGKEGKRITKPSKQKYFERPNQNEIKEFNLKKELHWTRLGNLTLKIGDVDHRMPKTVENGIPYLSTSNILSNGEIDFNSAKLISEKDYKQLSIKIKPEIGDIIFPRYGTIGRNVIVKTDRSFLVSYSCAIIKNIRNVMLPEFILYFSLSPVIKKEIDRYIVETTQANIGISSIERFVVPLFSIQEQTQIVKEIESRLSVCDTIEKQIADSLKQAETLRQSILKKAFEGKLLSEQELEICKQASDYEPAAILLERIKAEKEASLPKKKITTKKKQK